jgi:hypothetical protein
LGFPTGWSFTTHKDLLLHASSLFSGAITKQQPLFWRHHQVAASFLAPLPGNKEE